MGIDVFMECKVLRLLTDADGRDLGRRRLLAPDRRVRDLLGQGGRAGHRRDRQVLEVHLELLGVDRRRPRHGPVGRRRPDRHGVRPVPPDRHGLAAVGAGPPRHRGRPRRRRGAAQQRGRAVHVQLRRRRCSGPRRPRPRRRPTAGTTTTSATGGPPDLLPRDEVARAINTEVKAGRGSPHGGVFLDIASRAVGRVHPPAPARRCTTSSWSWPASTSPTDADGGRARPATTSWAASGSTPTPRRRPCRAVRRRRGRRRHARRQPARRQLAVRPARLRPAGRHRRRRTTPRAAPATRRSTPPRSTRPWPRPWPRFDRDGGENPYDVQHDLQETMQALVGHHPHRRRAGARRWTKLDELQRAGGEDRRSAAAGPTTRAGTWPRTFRPC